MSKVGAEKRLITST